MFNKKNVSVVISTYREKNSIRSFIDKCYETGYVDEVIVVNNNAEPGTVEEVAMTNAKLVHEHRQGYGYGYRRGLKEAQGDYIIMTEADGTFCPSDFEKLLIYGKSYPFVIGSRTANHSIIKGANMGHFLKWGNWTVAKMIEVLFLTTQLDDVGCTTRLIHKSTLEKIQPNFRVGGSHFGLEMMLIVIKNKIKFVSIPLYYLPRIGVSAVTGSFLKSLLLGVTMIYTVLKARIIN